MIIEAGQVAVVTGAAQGLGRALAAGLIDRSVSVVLADTATERLCATAEEFTARGGRVLPVITNVLTEHLPTDLSTEQMEQLKRGIATMMEPEVAAEHILAAVEADRLYALTHGDFEDGVRHRAEGILTVLGDRGWSENQVRTTAMSERKH
jgi:NAD(P)-dependent dehydrogenase (short-subunit alcohol dehydrogenase family)